MTPEELNRTIEFIIQSQARLATAQEQDRQDRIEFQEWSKELSAQTIRLLDHQSRRMDRLDKFYEDWLRQDGDFQRQSLDFQRQSLDFQRQALDFQRQALHLFHLILDRLPPNGVELN
jgi:hypothetical protein